MPSREAHDALVWMLDGYTRAMLGVAARLNLADLLVAGPLTGPELAAQTGQHPQGLSRMMRALAARGVFHEGSDGRFRLTPISELLRSDVAGSLRATALWRNSDHHALNLEWLPNTITTGVPASQAAFGEPFFQHLASQPEELALFTAMMAAGSGPGVIGNRHLLAAASGAFAESRVVVDVAGGRGQLLVEVLRATPATTGILFDRPEVITTASEYLQAAGVADRVKLVGGDFFATVPSGGDTYVLSQIMHDWYDAECLTILRNIYSSAAPGARVLIVERVLPAAGASSPTFAHDTTQDINMMVGVGGMERTEAEYRSLFERSRFVFVRDWPTESPVHVLEATKV